MSPTITRRGAIAGMAALAAAPSLLADWPTVPASEYQLLFHARDPIAITRADDGQVSVCQGDENWDVYCDNLDKTAVFYVAHGSNGSVRFRFDGLGIHIAWCQLFR